MMGLKVIRVSERGLRSLSSTGGPVLSKPMMHLGLLGMLHVLSCKTGSALVQNSNMEHSENHNICTCVSNEYDTNIILSRFFFFFFFFFFGGGGGGGGGWFVVQIWNKTEEGDIRMSSQVRKSKWYVSVLEIRFGFRKSKLNSYDIFEYPKYLTDASCWFPCWFNGDDHEYSVDCAAHTIIFHAVSACGWGWVSLMFLPVQFAQ